MTAEQTTDPASRNGNAPHSATVTALTAEVRVLMVGSRQVTMSVFSQLDEVEMERLTPMGRVRPKDAGRWAVGSADGQLAKAWLNEYVFDGEWEEEHRERLQTLPKAMDDMRARIRDMPRSIAFARERADDPGRNPVGVPDLYRREAERLPQELERLVRTLPKLEAEHAALVEAERQAEVRKAQRIAAYEALPLIVLAGLR